MPLPAVPAVIFLALPALCFGAPLQAPNYVFRSSDASDVPWPKPSVPAEFSAPVKATIDLSLPPEQRWVEAVREAVKAHGPDGSFGPVIEYFHKVVPKQSMYPLVDAFGQRLLHEMGTELAGEIQGVASELKRQGISDFSAPRVALLNAVYELQASCTSFVADSSSSFEAGESGCPVVHGRNLDWGAFGTLDLSNVTVLAKFVDGNASSNSPPLFQSLTWLGYVGVLTGVRTNGFSASIDLRDSSSKHEELVRLANILYASAGAQPTAIYLRKVLQYSTSYSEAVDKLSSHPIAARVYYIVGGIGAGEGAVITRDRLKSADVWEIGQPRNSSSVAKGEEWYVLQTNYDRWGPAPDRDDRRDVADGLLDKMTESNVNVQTARDVLVAKGVFVHATVYSTAMCAAQGLMDSSVWQRK